MIEKLKYDFKKETKIYFAPLAQLAWIAEKLKNWWLSIIPSIGLAPMVEKTTKLEDSEQWRMQMACISTAALGYCTPDQSIHPDYDTVALRNVAELYVKYDRLFKVSIEAKAALYGCREVIGSVANIQHAIDMLERT